MERSGRDVPLAEEAVLSVGFPEVDWGCGAGGGFFAEDGEGGLLRQFGGCFLVGCCHGSWCGLFLSGSGIRCRAWF